KRRGESHPALLAAVAFFGGLSTVTNVAAISQGVALVKARADRPVQEREAAAKAVTDQATAVGTLRSAAVARVENEMSYLTRHMRPAADLDAVSAFQRDQGRHLDDLRDLLDRWKGLDATAGIGASQDPARVWAALQQVHAQAEGLAAETAKLTADGVRHGGTPPLTLPPVPVPEVTEAADVRAGINDPTGLAIIRRTPLPNLALYAAFSAMLDFGPFLLALGLEARRRGHDGDEADGAVPAPEPLLADRWAERARGLRRVGDDLLADPLAAQGDAVIAGAVAQHRLVEAGALHNLTERRDLEVLGERLDTLHEGALAADVTEDETAALREAAFADWLRRRALQQQVRQTEFELALARQRAELDRQRHELDAAADQERANVLRDRLVLVRQIADMQAQVDELSGEWGDAVGREAYGVA
ncbi:MAG: hypothetical protein JO250_19860, partial [Armatimonadetes bacterium]|nr:hypothetical protein [Armatimonadota bacterium]